MDPQIFEHRQLDDMIGLIAIVLGIFGAALPGIVFTFARKVMREQEHLAGAAIGGAVLVSVVGLLVAGLIVLAVTGWLPSPREFL